MGTRWENVLKIKTKAYSIVGDNIVEIHQLKENILWSKGFLSIQSRKLLKNLHRGRIFSRQDVKCKVSVVTFY